MQYTCSVGNGIGATVIGWNYREAACRGLFRDDSLIAKRTRLDDDGCSQSASQAWIQVCDTEYPAFAPTSNHLRAVLSVRLHMHRQEDDDDQVWVAAPLCWGFECGHVLGSLARNRGTGSTVGQTPLDPKRSCVVWHDRVLYVLGNTAVDVCRTECRKSVADRRSPEVNNGSETGDAIDRSANCHTPSRAGARKSSANHYRDGAHITKVNPVPIDTYSTVD